MQKSSVTPGGTGEAPGKGGDVRAAKAAKEMLYQLGEILADTRF